MHQQSKSLDDASTIGFLGIAGTGMRGLAWILKQQGKAIVGTDQHIPAGFNAHGQFELAQEEAFINAIKQKKVDLVIATDAAPADHPALHTAAAHNTPTMRYHAALGAITSKYTTVIAVAGTHGKSSTTAFLAHILTACGKDPTALIGANIPSWTGENARVGKSDLFIVEADEYRRHFLSLQPSHLIVTTVEYDHPDYFASVEDVYQAFQELISNVGHDGTVITLESTKETTQDSIVWPSHTIIVSSHVDKSIPAPLPGEHMQRNAALAIAGAKALGVPTKQARKTLESFPGLSRRFEEIGTINTMKVISDYGHHPTEIAATLTAARSTYPYARILIVIEIHMRQRLSTFFDAWAQELARSDEVLLYPPFTPTGRSTSSTDAELESLREAIMKNDGTASILYTPDNIHDYLVRASSKHDIALIFSAGTLDEIVRISL